MPNKIPRGYIFHGLSINLNTFLNIRTRKPPPSRLSAGVASAFEPSEFACVVEGGEERMTRMRLIRRNKIQAFPMPRMMRKAADTEVPIIPPTLLKPSKRFSRAPAVAATTMPEHYQSWIHVFE